MICFLDEGAVRWAAIECSERCVLGSQQAVTACECRCHREIGIIYCAFTALRYKLTALLKAP